MRGVLLFQEACRSVESFKHLCKLEVVHCSISDKTTTSCTNAVGDILT